MAAPRVVTAFIAPITVAGLRPSAFKKIEVEIDPHHPVSKQLIESVARMSVEDINVGLRMINDSGRDNADVRSWRELLEGELAFREQQRTTNPLFAIAAAMKSKKEH